MTVGAGIFGYTQTAVWLSAVVHEMFTTQSLFSAKKTHLSTQLLRHSSPVINWTWLFFRHTNSLRLRRVQLTVIVWTDSSLVTSHKTGKVSLEARQLSLSALSLWLHSCDFTQTINKLKLKSFFLIYSYASAHSKAESWLAARVGDQHGTGRRGPGLPYVKHFLLSSSTPCPQTRELPLWLQ